MPTCRTFPTILIVILAVFNDGAMIALAKVGRGLQPGHAAWYCCLGCKACMEAPYNRAGPAAATSPAYFSTEVLPAPVAPSSQGPSGRGAWVLR